MEIKNNIITLNSWREEDFLSELKRSIDVNSNEIFVEFNDVLMKNINFFFESISLDSLNKIIFVKQKNIEFDIVCLSRAKRYFQEYFANLSEKVIICFENFEEDYVINEIIGTRNYFIYCYKNNIQTHHQKWFLEKEKKMIKKYSFLNKYKEFEFLKEKLEKHPISSFNFPKEENQDRFVYYYYVYNEDSKLDLINYMKELNFSDKYLDYVKKTKLNNPVMGYGLGFSYKNNKIIRRTLYISFYNPNDVEGTASYYKENLGIDILSNSKFNNIWFGGIDDYFDLEEIKVYEENTLFLGKLEDKNLEKIFKGKNSTRVVKFRENKIVNEKVEFNLIKNFSKEEREYLKQKKLISNGFRILAIYLKNGVIIKSTQYEL